MSGERVQRVAEEIKKEIARIIQEELKDPRIGFVTITRVDLSRDLRMAKVYFSLLGSKKQLRDTKVGLEKSANFIRRLLGQRMHLRYVPQIMFRLDENIEYSIHISKVLDQLKHKDESDERKQGNSGNKEVF
jgi:ribosome-binding factor A